MSAVSTTAKQVVTAINTGVSVSGTTKYLAEQPTYTTTPARSLIWSGVEKGGRAGGQITAAIGQGAREESYLIKGIARAQNTAAGTTEAQILTAVTTAQNDAYAVADAVADWVRSNPTCGVIGVRLVELEHVGLVQTWDATDQKIRIAQVAFQIRVHARI
jgi:hypothetical protein